MKLTAKNKRAKLKKINNSEKARRKETKAERQAQKAQEMLEHKNPLDYLRVETGAGTGEVYYNEANTGDWSFNPEDKLEPTYNEANTGEWEVNEKTKEAVYPGYIDWKDHQASALPTAHVKCGTPECCGQCGTQSNTSIKNWDDFQEQLARISQPTVFGGNPDYVAAAPHQNPKTSPGRYSVTTTNENHPSQYDELVDWSKEKEKEDQKRTSSWHGVVSAIGLLLIGLGFVAALWFQNTNSVKIAELTDKVNSLEQVNLQYVSREYLDKQIKEIDTKTQKSFDQFKLCKFHTWRNSFVCFK